MKKYVLTKNQVFFFKLFIVGVLLLSPLISNAQSVMTAQNVNSQNYELKDVMRILQVLTGVQDNDESGYKDINGDGKAGMEDVAGILQTLAGLRNPTVYYKDTDDDGYSDGTTLEDSVQPGGYYESGDLIATSGDCNDADAGVNPGATEVCNDGIDNDCNGSIDCTDSACADDASCNDDMDPETAVSYPVVDTGQTGCYDDDGVEITCTESGEAFYGQDAQFTGNQSSYTDNGDGTVTDNVTGLVWQQSPASTGLSYQEAEAYCESLELAEYDDWRIPTTKELFSISDFSQGWPYLDTAYFDLAESGSVSKDEQYWTEYYVGTTVEGGSEAAFGVNHATGHIKAYPATVSGQMGNYVRAVRSNTTYGINDFEDNSDGTVTDHSTGLMWQQADSGSGMDWEDALTYAENLTEGGYDDWRLPNIKELQSIVDYTRSPSAADSSDLGPAIDTDFFNITAITSGTTNYDPDYGYFWTNTSAYFGGDSLEYYYAWYVAFGSAVGQDGADFHGAGAARFDTKYEGGALGEGGERYYNYVRCVRDINSGTETSAWYMDADADGYGDPVVSLQAHTQPDGYVSDNIDCDDTDANVNPGVTEICGDGIDQDCDGSDLVCATTVYYKDADTDGYSDGSTLESSVQPAGYYESGDLIATSDDCDDTDANVNPGTNEVCDDGIDNDCNGSIDCGDNACINDAACAEDTFAALVINEIVAKDADGGNDWIELLAMGGTVFLGNYSIVDDDPDHEPQVLPDISLSEGNFYVVEAIDEEDECPDGNSCVSFKLGKDDAVTLFKNSVQVDILDWADGEAGEGDSFGLLPDGTGTAQTLSPTKGTANETVTDESGDTDDTDDTDTVEDTFAAVMINEVVAKATAAGEDWIEFYVSGTESINLSNYTVVDDKEGREPAALPNVTLTPGKFYVVLATDEAPEDGSAYVPFKLGSDDCVSLFTGDNLIDKLDWEDGDALIGYSYGCYPDGSKNTQTLSPTKGAANETAERGNLVINEIMAKDIDGGFDWFELYNAGDTAVALGNYQVTDDGQDQEPVVLPEVSLSPGDFIVIYATGEDTDDVSYWVDFKLGASDSLSLILDDEVVDYMEWEDSDAPEGFSYGLYPDGTWDTQTLELTPLAKNEPVDFFSEDTVGDVYITISETDWNSILSSPLEEEYHTASITYRNITLDDVAFRTKGASSLQAVADMNGTRYSFKVDMNYYVDGQKLLGMKKINLNNNYKDPSYMRELIAYDMMRSLDIPAPRLSYVNLYINGSLHGLYTLVEQVDSEFLEENFDNSDGDLYKPDGTGSDLLWYGTNFASYSGVELKTNEETSDNAAFINMVNELNNGSDLESVIDADEVLRYFAVSTAMSNLDSYQGSLAHNYYIYERDSVFSIIPWDFNESFGTFTMGCQDPNAMITFYIDEPTSGALADRPLIAKLLEHEDYKTAYHGYIEDLISGTMDSSIISITIEDTKNLISGHVANDPTAFYSYAEFETALGYGMVGNIFGLQGFADDRTLNIIGQLSGTEPSEGDGSGSCSGMSGGGPMPPGPPRP